MPEDFNSKIIEEFRANGEKADYPGFADYETKTSRRIPVVILEPVS